MPPPPRAWDQIRFLVLPPATTENTFCKEQGQGVPQGRRGAARQGAARSEGRKQGERRPYGRARTPGAGPSHCSQHLGPSLDCSTASGLMPRRASSVG